MATWIDLGPEGDWLNLDQVSRVRDSQDGTLLLWLNNDVNGGTVRVSGAARTAVLEYLQRSQRQLGSGQPRAAHPDTSSPEGGPGPTVYQPHTAR
jgi:hypothetical protein